MAGIGIFVELCASTNYEQRATNYEQRAFPTARALLNMTMGRPKLILQQLCLQLRVGTRPLAEGWTRNGPIRLHYIDNQGSANLTPLIIIPGFASTAEDFKDIVEALVPRRCVAASLRGRGKSDTPSSGYTLADHASDIASLVVGLGFQDICLMAHSRGVPYAIQFARAHKDSVKGLILLDYPARHSQLPQRWATSFLSSDFGKAAIPGRVRLETVRGVQEDSDYVLLWEALEELDFPALVIRGGSEGSLLKDEDADMYTKHMKDCQISRFEESSHDVWKPDLPKFINTLNKFLLRVES